MEWSQRRAPILTCAATSKSEPRIFRRRFRDRQEPEPPRRRPFERSLVDSAPSQNGRTLMPIQGHTTAAALYLGKYGAKQAQSRVLIQFHAIKNRAIHDGHRHFRQFAAPCQSERKWPAHAAAEASRIVPPQRAIGPDAAGAQV